MCLSLFFFFFLIFTSCNDAYFCAFLPKLVGDEEQSCSLFLFDSIFSYVVVQAGKLKPTPKTGAPNPLAGVELWISISPVGQLEKLFPGRCSQALEEMMPLVLKSSFDRLRKLENLPFRHISVFNEGEGNSVKCSKKGGGGVGCYRSFLIKETEFECTLYIT